MENKKELEVLMEDGVRDLSKYLDVKFKEVHDEFDKVQDKLNKFNNNNDEIFKLLKLIRTLKGRNEKELPGLKQII